jgi:Zn-dependent M28 family amino/carboxypeptidase
MALRDVGFFLRGRLNRTVSRLQNRRAAPAGCAVPLEDVLRGEATPLALARVIEGRANEAREAAVARYLEARGAPLARRRFSTFEGAGENLWVDVGSGDRILVLVAHHDAVPGSPGANDNAAAVGILLHLLERLDRCVPPHLRVRLLFTAAEELGYLGARAWVQAEPLAGIAGVLSLELCGIGDSLAIWDAPEGAAPPFLTQLTGALDGLGHRRDEGYHVVGRIPVFGSDHRAFAAVGLPAYGLTVVPSAEAAALRQFVFRPLRSVFRQLVRRPPPFDTYHTSRDALATLDPAALERVARALEAIVRTVR